MKFIIDFPFSERIVVEEYFLAILKEEEILE
jgi:hypothetical protein